MYAKIEAWIKGNRVLSALVAAITVLAAVAAIASPIRDFFDWRWNDSASPRSSPGASLAVNRPEEEERIYGCMVVSGTGRIPAGKTLWVSHRTIVGSEEVGPYYTFRQARQSEDGASWRTARFNIGEDGREQRFLMLVFMVPEEVVPFMNGVISEGGKALDEGGNLSSKILPPYADMVREVKVTRPKGTCPA